MWVLIQGLLLADGTGSPSYARLCASLRAAQAASPTGRAHIRLAGPAESAAAPALLAQVRTTRADRTCRFHTAGTGADRQPL